MSTRIGMRAERRLGVSLGFVLDAIDTLVLPIDPREAFDFVITRVARVLRPKGHFVAEMGGQGCVKSATTTTRL